MKIAIVSGAGKAGDAARGIGVHNSELFKVLRKLRNKKITAPDIGQNDKLSKFEVVHFTSFRPFFISLPLKKPKNTKFILTIHDLIPLLYPNHYKPGIKGNIKFLINKLLVKKNVDAIITISETSKKDICRLLGVNPDIVHVIYLGPKEEYKEVKDDKKLVEVKKRFNLPDKFIFYYGDINYNKNIPTLVEACVNLGIKLVIAGKQAGEVERMNFTHSENLHLKPILKYLLDASKVLRLGYIGDEDANCVLNTASALVQPSLYEGFGLSVIHAFAAGCPVIASKTQALVEVGGDACLYFDPKNEKDLKEKIKLMISDSKLREIYVKEGFERVKMFSWEKCAKQTLAVYDLVQ